MDVSSVPTAAMAVDASPKQLQGALHVQVALLRELAESQQQVAQMLADSGLGQNVDVMA